ncbi:MAG: DJ-1/PfpI family protein [Candidatus Ancaeobacter aquaticus]|nr:DJ-1/PfpI family protein [Candidatus Ancaeobacter aquaticus]
MSGVNNAILMIIAPNEFRDEEYLVPKDIFESAEYHIVTASTRTGECIGKLGHVVIAEKTLQDIDVREYCAIIFVGGKGSKGFWDDALCHSIARDALSLGSIVAAICSAPIIFARAGLLAGKKATCFSGDGEQLRLCNAIYNESDIEIDGNVITADGPASAEKFAQAVLGKCDTLKGRE